MSETCRLCDRPVHAHGLCRRHWERTRRDTALDAPHHPVAPYGVWGQLTIDDDGRVLCHECGRGWANLGGHVVRSHGMTAREYKIEYGLPVTKGLSSPGYREMLRDRIQTIPEMTDHLPPAGAAIGSQDPAMLRRAGQIRDPEPAARAVREKLGRPEVRTCPDCGAQWCPMPGTVKRRWTTQGCGSDHCASRMRMKASLTTPSERAVRNRRILDRAAAGETRRQIAARYDLTPEAAGQIIRRALP